MKLSKAERKRQRLGTVSLEQVFALMDVSHHLGYKTRATVLSDQGQYHQVHIYSHRLRLFKTNLTCVSCGRVGAYFGLDLDPPCGHPHLNLYTEDGILMTKDHIVPKSKGGSNEMSNYQTMCTTCNWKKGDKLDTPTI